MLQLRTGRTLKRAQTVWTVVCILGLADNIIGQSSSTSMPSPPRTTIKSEISQSPPVSPSQITNTSETSNATTEAMQKTTQISDKSAITTSLSWLQNATSTSPSVQLKDEITSSALPSSTVNVTSEATRLTSGHTGPSALTHQSSAAQTSSTPDAIAQAHVQCLNVKSLSGSAEVISLELNETTTCESFREEEEKQKRLVKMLCDSPKSTFLKSGQCHLQLSTSEVNPKHLLLILSNKDDAKKTFDNIQRQTYTLHQMGIQQYKMENVSNHQDRSRKTLIALLTCGLLLAAIIMAGFFLSNRQSWSPGRQRLGEDPYYTENDSQDNTVLSVASNDQSRLQEKRNLKGGTQENGTGQTATAATNGHSTRQHAADTEL